MHAVQSSTSAAQTFTNSDADLSWCAVSSTVTSHQTNIVVLVVVQTQLDTCVGGGRDRLRF